MCTADCTIRERREGGKDEGRGREGRGERRG